jgi:hypothetical protein
MNRDPLPYPPQMRNGGSLLAHLSLSFLSNPSGWLQYKWSQPPPRAPDWVFDDYQKFNPPADVGCPFHNKEWLQRALRKDQQAAGLLPPKLPGGPILLGACAHAERAYQDWKWTVDALWEVECHRIQMAACQCHIDEQATRKQQEAAHCQQLLDKCAAYERQEAVRRQWLLDKETACRQHLLDKEAARCLMAECAAFAQQMAAARTIFLWLCHRRLHVWLARQTSRRQQCESTLAPLQYKQDCCSRMALVEEQ